MAGEIALRPYQPNWTHGQPPAPPGPSTAVGPNLRPNWTYGQPSQPFDFDAGPGNARVSPGGSPEAQAWQGVRNANMGPQPSAGGAAPTAPAAPAPPGSIGQQALRSLRGGAQAAMNGVRSMGFTGANIAKMSIPAVIGAGIGMAQRSTDANAEPAEPFTAPPAAPGQIPVDPGLRAPAFTPSHPLGFGPDNEFTRNLANTVNAIPGSSGVMGTGLRAGSNAAKVAGALNTGQQVIRGAQGASEPTAPIADLRTPANPIAPNPTDQRLAAGTQGAALGTPAAGPTITRVGNSFSDGSDPGSLRSVSTIPGAGVVETMQQIANIRNLPGPELGGLSGIGHRGGTETFGPSLSVLTSGNMKPRDLRHAQSIAAEREIAANRNANERSIAGLREGGEMARANLNAGTQRAINERQVDATLRGQDITREGHILTNNSARTRLLYDMNKDQRDFGASRDDANFSQGQAAQKAMHEQIANMLPPLMVDGKPTPDTAAAARHMTGLNAAVGSRMQQLQDHLKLNPTDRQAASELQGLQARGVAQIPQDQVRKLVMGQRAAEIAAATHTGPLVPWGSTAKASNAPVSSLRDDGNGNYLTDRGDVIPKRYIDREGSTLGFGGKQTVDFDILKGVRQ